MFLLYSPMGYKKTLHRVAEQGLQINGKTVKFITVQQNNVFEAQIDTDEVFS